MSTHLFIYDIETIPLDAAALERVMPVFEAPGNYKDPEKIEAAIAEKRAEWTKKAALSPTTGRVAMIGIQVNDEAELLMLRDMEKQDEQEREMLVEFWAKANNARELGMLLVGFNSHRFDIPFLVRRSWALRVPVPSWATERLRLPCVDLMQLFTFGAPGEYVSLDTVAKFLGAGAKNGNCLDVARQLREAPDEAMAYLRNDLEITSRVAVAMGVYYMGAPAAHEPAVEKLY